MNRCIVIAFLITCATLHAQNPAPDYLRDLKPYQPVQQVEGTIRIYGNNYIPALMKTWEDGFRKYQPNVRFTTNLPGTEAAMAGLYGGIADLAFIGREGYRTEIDAFHGRFGYDPLGLMISSGSFATPHKTFSLEVFVHKDNPLHGLTMQQVGAIFGCGNCPTCPAPQPAHAIRTWGDLGLGGAWKTRPIHVYGYNFDTGMAGYFDRQVLNGTGRWNEALKDFDNGRDANGEVINAGVYILAALAKDPYGIAFANVLYQNPEVRTVALASGPGKSFYQATLETTWKREYPITRFSTVYLNRAPGKPVDPKVEEFLRYILSRDGMAAVVQDGAYLPLNPAAVQQQLEKLQ